MSLRERRSDGQLVSSKLSGDRNEARGLISEKCVKLD